jgi:hypothetical protein
MATPSIGFYLCDLCGTAESLSEEHIPPEGVLEVEQQSIYGWNGLSETVISDL